MSPETQARIEECLRLAEFIRAKPRVSRKRWRKLKGYAVAFFHDPDTVRWSLMATLAAIKDMEPSDFAYMDQQYPSQITNCREAVSTILQVIKAASH